MKRYRLIVTSEVFEDLDRHLDYLTHTHQDPLLAERWARKALACLESLATFPHRCPKALEDAHYDFTLRMLVVDTSLFTYRVEEANRVVRILGFRSTHQQSPDA